jgi:hypothetical protein
MSSVIISDVKTTPSAISPGTLPVVVSSTTPTTQVVVPGTVPVVTTTPVAVTTSPVVVTTSPVVVTTTSPVAATGTTAGTTVVIPMTTTASAAPTKKPSALLHPIIFGIGSVLQFREQDFYLNTRELIPLRYDDCIICLFYDDSDESARLCNIWADVSSQVVNIVFGACHLGMEVKVANNFNKLSKDELHPFYWARVDKVPFILVYQRGWPTKKYDGNLTQQAIMNFALNSACKTDTYISASASSVAKTSASTATVVNTSSATVATTTTVVTTTTPSTSVPVVTTTPVVVVPVSTSNIALPIK